jgi:hypothetical protein
MKLVALQMPKIKHIVLFTLVSTPYIFLLSKGSFLVDDWGQLANGRSYIMHFKEWEALWAYRPVSWILIPAILQLFQDSYFFVAFFHFSLVFFSIQQIVTWRRLELSTPQRKLSVILLAAPVFSSTFLLSPVNQLSASLSLSFFALGLFIERRGLLKQRSAFFVYLCFFSSTLCYEISIPLILIHYLFSIKESPRNVYRVAALPILLSLIIVWQKIIAVQIFDSDFSRLDSLDPLTLLSFFVSLVFSAPYYLSVGFIENFVAIILVSTIIYYVLRPASWVFEKVKRDRSTLIILLIGLGSNGGLFLLSGRYASVDGYQNRGLTSTWIIFALILSSLLVKWRSWITVFVVILAATNFVLFAEKIVESSLAGDARQKVIEEILRSQELTEGATDGLVLDLPCFLPKANFRNEIFCTAWDARGALAHNDLRVLKVLVLANSSRTEMKELDVDQRIFLVSFDTEFKISRIESVTRESKLNLIQRAEGNYLKSQTLIASCKSKLAGLSKFEISGSFQEYLECVKLPL